MIKNQTSRLILAGLALGATPAAHAVALIAPGDPVYAISLNQDNNVAANETADKANDGDSSTKYLNFGKYFSGIIYSGSTAFNVQSLSFTTANDSLERDPTSYILLGSNDATITTTNPTAVSNGWTFISTGALSLSNNRLTTSTLDIASNTASYSSYWMIFPTLKEVNASGTALTANSMQIAEANLFSGTGATGTRFTATTTVGVSQTGQYPNNSDFAEQPNKVVDGNPATKYLNFGKAGTGFVVYPSVGNTIPTGFVLTSANDVQGRDPANYTIYGQTNDGVWRIITSGTLTSAQMPATRSTAGEEIPYTTDGTIYKAYGFVANTLVSSSTVNSFQLGDFQVNGYAIPETSSALLGMMGLFGLMGIRRRK